MKKVVFFVGLFCLTILGVFAASIAFAPEASACYACPPYTDGCGGSCVSARTLTALTYCTGCGCNGATPYRMFTSNQTCNGVRCWFPDGCWDGIF